MKTLTHFVRCAALLAGLALAAGPLAAGEKAVMHCFAFTEIEGASQADWAAFAKATDELPKTMKGIVTKVWHGKLRAPLNQFSTDRETSKKLAAGEKNVAGTVNRAVRQHGVCMEMPSLDAYKQYGTHAAHAAWVAAYEKVRVAGTTTYQIVGE